MKRFLLLLLPLCLASCAINESLTLDASSAHSWTLPVRFVFNLPVIDLQIGAHTVPVVIDTGSNGTIWLAPAVAQRVGARFTGQSSTYYDAHGHAFAARNYVLSECALDGIKLRNIEGREFASAADGGPEIQGIIGLGVLRHFRVVFDWPRAAMELSTGGLAGREQFRQVPMRWTSYGLETHVVIDGTELEFIWDTGASASILKFGRVAARLLTKREGYLMYAAAHMHIGGTDFGAQDFYMQDLEEPPGDGLIGANFFMKHRVLLDLEANVLGVE
ncbi:hypothetical protein PLCT2_03002 [Planctomycetaceae bacterium]|nr:hypothetical protein PLCT2_03002 [Planctomycetaceae bacterium]